MISAFFIKFIWLGEGFLNRTGAERVWSVKWVSVKVINLTKNNFLLLKKFKNTESAQLCSLKSLSPLKKEDNIHKTHKQQPPRAEVSRDGGRGSRGGLVAAGGCVRTPARAPVLCARTCARSPHLYRGSALAHTDQLPPCSWGACTYTHAHARAPRAHTHSGRKRAHTTDSRRGVNPPAPPPRRVSPDHARWPSATARRPRCPVARSCTSPQWRPGDTFGEERERERERGGESGRPRHPWQRGKSFGPCKDTTSTAIKSTTTEGWRHNHKLAYIYIYIKYI